MNPMMQYHILEAREVRSNGRASMGLIRLLAFGLLVRLEYKYRLYPISEGGLLRD